MKKKYNSRNDARKIKSKNKRWKHAYGNLEFKSKKAKERHLINFK